MNILIAIVTCHARKARADAQRQSWVRNVKDADVRFFLGRGGAGTPGEDEVWLDVDDGYSALPLKVRAVMRWAREHGYGPVCKIDDDVFVYPDRLLEQIPAAGYAGAWNETRTPETPHGYCSGFAYWLGSLEVAIIARAALTAETSEDRWVASVLNQYGIKPESQPGFLCASSTPPHRCLGPDVVAICEFNEKEMVQAQSPPGGWQERAERNRLRRARQVRKIMRGDGRPFFA